MGPLMDLLYWNEENRALITMACSIGSTCWLWSWRRVLAWRFIEVCRRPLGWRHTHTHTRTHTRTHIGEQNTCFNALRLRHGLSLNLDYIFCCCFFLQFRFSTNFSFSLGLGLVHDWEKLAVNEHITAYLHLVILADALIQSDLQ